MFINLRCKHSAMCCPFLKSVGKFDDATRLNVLAVSKEADLKGGSSMTRGKSLSLVNDQDS